MNQKQMDSVAAHLGGGRPNFSVELMVRHNRTAITHSTDQRPGDAKWQQGHAACYPSAPSPGSGAGRLHIPKPKILVQARWSRFERSWRLAGRPTTVPGRDQVELSMWCSQPTTIYVPVHNILVSDRQMAFRSTYVRARSSVFWGSVLFLLFCLGRPSERPETFSDPCWDGWICRPVPSVRTGH